MSNIPLPYWHAQYLARLAAYRQFQRRLAYVPQPPPAVPGFTPNVSRVTRPAPPADWHSRLGGDWSDN
ncbi:MAG TPA: hypothetical protein VMU04_10275 [Candidatus Acidoferrum sp.]|nr:hypothetical protein [Candidatus Acidoferrum sp.]